MKLLTSNLMRLVALVAVTYTAAYAEQIPLQPADDQAIAGRTRPVNVAIIGAGAAGSSTAYHLAEFSSQYDVPINITIFERNDYIGGRTTTVYAYNDPREPVELGASIFVQANKILVEAVKKWNLTTSGLRPEGKEGDVKIPGDRLAVWDGQRIILSQNGGWWDYAKLFWRYGTAPYKSLGLMKKTIAKFLQLYEAPIFPFQSLTQAAQDVGLLAVTAATGEQYMRENGITGQFGREVVQASTRVNYAQNLGYISGLVGMVCLATDGAVAVEGGNWRLFEHMVGSSEATVLLEREVAGIFPQNSGGYALNWSNPVTGKHSGSQIFDQVVLAAPFQFSNIVHPGTTDADLVEQWRVPEKVPYVHLHVTLFTSPHLLSPAFFNLPSDQPAPQIILTTLPPEETPQKGKKGVGSPGFLSISLLQPIVNPHTAAQEYLYKIFSPEPANATFLASLLGVQDLPGNDEETISERDVTWIYRKVWDSYPYEYPRVTFEEVKLAEGMWYTSGMDSFISTMETNALMGMNVARLIVDEVAHKERVVGYLRQ